MSYFKLPAISRMAKGVLLTLSVYTSSSFAAQQIDIMLPNSPPSNATAQQSKLALYQVSPLAPDVIAALNTASRFAVVDANGNSMPVYYETELTQQTTQLSTAAIYNWEDAKDIARFNQQAKVNIQVNGDAVAIMAEADQTARHHAQEQHSMNDVAGNGKPNTLSESTVGEQLTRQQQKQAASSTWLVVLPKKQLQQHHTTSNNRHNESDYSATLDWIEKNQKYTVTIEGSDDLVNWVRLKKSVLVSLNAAQAQEAKVQQQGSEQPKWLKNRIADVSHVYPYWRLSFSQPVTLKNITLTQKNLSAPLMVEAPIEFKRSGDNTWQANLPRAWKLWDMRFDVPKQQVWQMTLSKQVIRDAELKPVWQTLATAQLYHPSNMQQHLQQDKQVDPNTNRIRLDSPTVAQKLKLEGHIPGQTLSARVLMPKQRLTFLAQGQAPYRLMLLTGKEKPNVRQVNLPRQLISQQAQPAELTTWQHLASERSETTRWFLWLVLGLVVFALMWMAYRLVKNLDSDSQAL